VSDYYWYRAHNICPRCKQNDAIPGQVLCPECAEKARKYRTAHRDRENARKRERRAQRKEQGLCMCGKPARPGRTKCLECFLRDRRTTKRKETKPIWLRREQGICLRCDEKAVEGRTLCAHHLELARQSVKVAKAAWYERRAQCSKVKL